MYCPILIWVLSSRELRTIKICAPTSIAIEVGAQIFIVRNSLDDNTHIKIGQYISQITTPDEKIWTSEGAIAFYAQRLIVAANSSDWPIQCAFSDIFAYDFGTYMGASMADYKNG